MEIKPTKRTTEVLMKVINEKPDAFAIMDSEQNIYGTVCFYNYQNGTIMIYEINGLPRLNDNRNGIFGFHIQEGNRKNQDEDKNFYRETQESSIYLEDLSPITATQGKAWSIVYIDKLRPEEILNRTLVIDTNVNGFNSQSLRQSSFEMASGIIKRFQ